MESNQVHIYSENQKTLEWISSPSSFHLQKFSKDYFSWNCCNWLIAEKDLLEIRKNLLIHWKPTFNQGVPKNMKIGKHGKMEDDFENIGTPCRIYSSILLTKEIRIIISIKNFQFQGCDRNETNAMHKTKQELPKCLLKGINCQRLFLIFF